MVAFCRSYNAMRLTIHTGARMAPLLCPVMAEDQTRTSKHFKPERQKVDAASRANELRALFCPLSQTKACTAAGPSISTVAVHLGARSSTVEKISLCVFCTINASNTWSRG
jgi:hypothetical protein